MSLDVADIQGELFLNQGFLSMGNVRALHFHVGQDIHATGALFKGNGFALRLEGAKIKDHVDLSTSLFSGPLLLGSAQIDEFLMLRGSKLAASAGTEERDASLDLDSISVGQNIDCDGAESSGTIRMQGGTIGDSLILSGAKLRGVEVINATIAGDVYWTGMQDPQQASLNLTGTTFNTLHDDRFSWPVAGSLGVDQAKYKDLVLYEHANASDWPFRGSQLPLVVNDRLDWLRRQAEPFTPQPWMQFAKVLEEKGDVVGAKHVRFVYKRLAGRSASVLFRPVGFVYDAVEENPTRILTPITSLWLLGFVVFWRARRMNAMAPTEKTAYKRHTNGEPLKGYTPFHPAIYALENVLPVIKLGQDAAWAPNPAFDPGQSVAGWRRVLPAVEYRWLARLRWTLIAVGWMLALILAGAIGSRFKS